MKTLLKRFCRLKHFATFSDKWKRRLRNVHYRRRFLSGAYHFILVKLFIQIKRGEGPGLCSILFASAPAKRFINCNLVLYILKIGALVPGNHTARHNPCAKVLRRRLKQHKNGYNR